jgi:hypothetical protein
VRFKLTIFDNIGMEIIKEVNLDYDVGTLKSACKLAEIYQDELSDEFPDTTIELERLDDA